MKEKPYLCSAFQIKLQYMMEKVKVNQDFLYQYLLDHDIIISAIMRTMGVSSGIVIGCFRHDLNRHGKPLVFSAKNIERLNAALPELAGAIRRSLLVFGTGHEFANSRGTVYDPGLLPAVKALSAYFNLNKFLLRVLGWKVGKKEMVLCSPSSKVFGNISRDDVDRINAELLSVAGVLSSYEVVPTDSDAVSAKPTESKRVKKERSGEGKTTEERHNEWDDTSLDLWERYARFHRLFPDGLIAFSVNDGFTVCEDDARLLARVDTTLQPYADPATGHVTLYMDAAKWNQIRRAWDDGDEMVAESPMYPAE